ncbi:MAG: adenylate/guanylate cyclase domain-containing protein [Methylovulum sp.]|nr:adenylate/guanylate cyclase domain-containing protein [Methylovulum sp.]
MPMLSSNKWLKIYRLMACIAMTFIFILHTTGWLEIPTMQRMENIFYDLRLRTTVVNTIDPRIVIVSIDEQSLAQEGRWPWSRDKMAYLVDMLFDYYGIRLLGFDVVFAEPDTSSGMALLDKLASGQLHDNRGFLSTIETLRPQLSFDEVYAKSLQNRPTVLGYFTSHIAEKNAQVGLPPAPVAQSDNLPFTSLLFHAKSYTANLAPLQSAALSGGFFNNPNVDQDGIYRKLPLLVQYHDHLYEALSLALFRALLGMPEIKFITGEGYGRTDSRLEGLRIEGFTIPVDAGAAILVPFRGKQGSFNYVSASDVLNGTAGLEKLKDKIVIVGTTAAGLLDSRATPVQSLYPGVEVHANVLSALLDQSIKSRPNYILAAEITELLFIGLLAVVIFPRVSIITSAAIFSTVLVGGMAANFYCWREWNIDTILAVPFTLLCLLYGVQIFFGFFLESRKKKQLGDIFGQYVPPELVELMSRSDEVFSLQGESRDMTVFFSDVRGFTTISETMAPHDLCELINAIFTPATRTIHESQGTIDKYIGDAIMAFWGAPMHDPRHASHAVQSALAIIQTLAAMQEGFKARDWPVIDMGIGINTGVMSVGNMGSEFRMAYTVMGDAVNLGSRLEGLTKQYGVKIIVSETTREAAPDFIYRELDRVRVKGKLKPITIYEPLSAKPDIMTGRWHYLDELNEGLQAYRQQQWDSATVSFKSLLAQYPDDKLYALYLERIGIYRQSPPEPDWDGVFTHTSK